VGRSGDCRDNCFSTCQQGNSYGQMRNIKRQRVTSNNQLIEQPVLRSHSTYAEHGNLRRNIPSLVADATPLRLYSAFTMAFQTCIALSSSHCSFTSSQQVTPIVRFEPARLPAIRRLTARAVTTMIGVVKYAQILLSRLLKAWTSRVTFDRDKYNFASSRL
jgi:hypothetical protein